MARAPGFHPWRRRAVGCAAVVVAAGIAVLTVTLTSADPSGYQKAVATSATVRSTLGVTGTISTVKSAVADFQVEGSVTAVDVEVGEEVTAGEPLASVDRTTLERDVTSADGDLQEAEVALTENEDDESASTGTTTGSSSSAGDNADASVTGASSSGVVEDALVQSASSGKGGQGGTASSTATTKLEVAQKAVVEAQALTDAEADDAAAALQTAKTACSGSTTTPASTTTTTTVPASTTTTVDAEDTDSSTSACSTALSDALSAQQTLQADEKAVQSAETTLADVLSSLSSASTSSSSTTGTATSTSGSSDATTKSGTSASGSSDATTKSGSTGSSTDSGSSSTSGSASSSSVAADSAQQLASDQATIDADRAAVVEAEAQLADATLTSPMTGKVALVDLATGDSVTSGDSDDGITIINSGSYETTVSLTTEQAAEVKVGDSVSVVVDGSSATLKGSVTRIGPADDDDGSYTYPMIVTMASGTTGIASGSTAEVSVLLHRVDYALAVPTSAVHTSGSGSYVDVVVKGKEVRQKVRVGAVGADYTQILSGVRKGDEVVLANLADKVPSSSTDSTTTSTRTGGFADVGGAGATGGGAVGGGVVGGGAVGGGAGGGFGG